MQWNPTRLIPFTFFSAFNSGSVSEVQGIANNKSSMAGRLWGQTC